MTRMSRRSLQALAGFAAAIVIGIGAARAFQIPATGSGPAAADDGQSHAEQAVIESMSHHHMEEDPHLLLTTRRPERPGDRERAAAIVAALRPALERYRDYQLAVQNGYEIFLPELPQPV